MHCEFPLLPSLIGSVGFYFCCVPSLYSPSVLLGWAADTPDPDNFFSPLLSCTATFSGKNAANWCNPQFDSLLNQALSTTDIALRKQYYDAAQSMIINELPLIPIAHGMRFQASSADVEGITLGPFGAISLANARKK